MDEAVSLRIEHTCAKLVHRFCFLVDAYRHEELTALWAEDSVWETWRGPIRGRSAIRAYLDAKLRTDVTIHMAHNIVINVVDECNASGSAVFTYHGTKRSDPASLTPRVVGRYFDRFVVTGDGWRFAHRRTEMTFTAS
ncbi:nuclear transport factor 2 family protein [Mesorhizobium sp. CAU 1741]|uniref:nuclear transport factor 2 family protein n=1 Tax=Mesorhizobium sp. CAU 1741 TaxID=3140366 RepID=UPI00325BB087